MAADRPRQLGETVLGLAELQDTMVRRLRTEDDVLHHRQVVGEHEVLVHHADTGGNCIGRCLEVRLVPEHGDGALVRLGACRTTFFIKVDLPAPFSPTMAWIVPGRTRNVMSWLAMTPGKVLPIPTSSTA